MGNTKQVLVDASGANIFWDNGFEGNYWSDYNGTDIDEDGIGDSPYIIDENNMDNYPLMEPGIIPEFPAWIPLLMVLIAIAGVLIIYKRKLSKTYRLGCEEVQVIVCCWLCFLCLLL